MLEELKELQSLLARLAGKELGIHTATTQTQYGYYESWDDGEYWLNQAKDIVDNLIATNNANSAIDNEFPDGIPF